MDDKLSQNGQRILAAQRHDEIMRRIASTGSAGISDVAQFFDVSRETIRRDMKVLAQRGQISLVHGGAMRAQLLEPDFGRRSQENTSGKAAIGRAGAAMLQADTVVFLDSGTTTLAVAQALAQCDKRPENLTVCTTSLMIALTLCHVAGMRVHMLGGEINPVEEASSGIDVFQALQHFRFDLAFLGTGGISAQGEITDFTRYGAQLRSTLAADAAQAWFLADAEKFSRITPLRVAHTTQANGVITDREPEPSLAEKMRDKGLKLLVAKM